MSKKKAKASGSKNKVKASPSNKKAEIDLNILGVITIDVPPQMLDAQGNASITVDLTADVTQVAAWVLRDGATPTADPLPFMRFKQVTSTHVTINGVGGAEAPIGGTSSHNMVVVWSKAAGPAWQSKAREPVTFERPATTPLVIVPATACLYFAYAPVDYRGPVDGEGDGEETGDAHRPVALSIPAGAKKVTLTTTGGQWQHSQSAGDLSGAGGLGGNNVTTHAAYKDDAQYKSGGINLLDAKFNRLVGFLESNLTIPTAGSPVNPIDIGAGPKEIDLTTGTYTRLFLGMHDSHEWDDNSGAVAVTVAWSF